MTALSTLQKATTPVDTAPTYAQPTTTSVSGTLYNVSCSKIPYTGREEKYEFVATSNIVIYAKDSNGNEFGPFEVLQNKTFSFKLVGGTYNFKVAPTAFAKSIFGEDIKDSNYGNSIDINSDIVLTTEHFE